MTNTLRIDCRVSGRDAELTSVLPQSKFAVITDGPPVVAIAENKYTRALMDEIVVVASSVADLKALQLTAESFGSTKALRLVVGGKVPSNMLSLSSGMIEGHDALEVSRNFRRDPIEHTQLYVRLAGRAALKRIIAATLSGNLPSHRRVTPSIRIGLAPDVDSRWGFSDALAKRLPTSTLRADDLGNNPGPKPEVDLLMTTQILNPLPLDHPPVIQVAEPSGYSWERIATAAPRDFAGHFAPGAVSEMSLSIPPVDTEVINPIGFDPFPTSGSCSIRWEGRHNQSLIGDAGSVVIGRLDRSRLSDRLLGPLRSFTFVHDYADSHPGPAQRAAFLIDAAAAGVPVVPHDLDPLTTRYLSSDLLNVYTGAAEEVFEERLLRESFVASAHRAAYRGHGHRNLLNPILSAGGLGSICSSRPTVSLLIPSKRPDFISNAVEQLKRQSWTPIQPIFGFHGFTLSDISERDRESLNSVSALIHEAAPDAVFGDVMNAMSQMADGALVAKMDDDDWYGEHHLEDLVHSHEYSRAILVGSGVQFVYLTRSDMTVRRGLTQAYKYGGHPGGPTILLGREDLKSVGNWARVNRAIDTALADAIAAAGGSVYQGNPLNFLFNKRASGHTWNASQEYFLRGKIDQWVGLRPPPGFTDEAANQVRERWRGRPTSLVDIFRFPGSYRPSTSDPQRRDRGATTARHGSLFQRQVLVDPWTSSFSADHRTSALEGFGAGGP